VNLHTEICSHDYNDEIGSGRWFDDWGRMEERWSRYVFDLFGQDKDNNVEESGEEEALQRTKVRKGKKWPEAELPMGDDGTPRIPIILNMSAQEKKDVMRAFVAYHYCKSLTSFQ